MTVGEAVGGIGGRAESSVAVIKQSRARSHDIMTSHIMLWGTLKNRNATHTAFSVCMCVCVCMIQNSTQHNNVMTSHIMFHCEAKHLKYVRVFT